MITTMKPTVFLSLFISAVILVGCSISQNNSGVNTHPDNLTVSDVKTIYEGRSHLPLSSSIVYPEDWSYDDRRNYEKKVSGMPENILVREFTKKVTKAQSWQEANELAQQCILQLSESKNAFHFQQLIASSMLRVYFINQSPKPEVQKYAEYYMNILIHHKNYTDPNLKAMILPLLIGYWSPEKLSRIAKAIFEKAVPPTWMTKEKWFESYYEKKIQQYMAEDATFSNEVV